MKRVILFLVAFVGAFVFFSCEDDKETKSAEEYMSVTIDGLAVEFSVVEVKDNLGSIEITGSNNTYQVKLVMDEEIAGTFDETTDGGNFFKYNLELRMDTNNDGAYTTEDNVWYHFGSDDSHFSFTIDKFEAGKEICGTFSGKLQGSSSNTSGNQQETFKTITNGSFTTGDEVKGWLDKK